MRNKLAMTMSRKLEHPAPIQIFHDRPATLQTQTQVLDTSLYLANNNQILIKLSSKHFLLTRPRATSPNAPCIRARFETLELRSTFKMEITDPSLGTLSILPL